MDIVGATWPLRWPSATVSAQVYMYAEQIRKYKPYNGHALS